MFIAALFILASNRKQPKCPHSGLSINGYSQIMDSVIKRAKTIDTHNKMHGFQIYYRKLQKSD